MESPSELQNEIKAIQRHPVSNIRLQLEDLAFGSVNMYFQCICVYVYLISFYQPGGRYGGKSSGISF